MSRKRKAGIITLALIVVAMVLSGVVYGNWAPLIAIAFVLPLIGLFVFIVWCFGETNSLF